MVMLTEPQPAPQTQQLARLVAQELYAADPKRFGRITVRGLYCGFIELDGVVASYYVKSLALMKDPDEIELSSEFDHAANDDPNA